MGMMNGTDAELLALFAREDSQPAFAELVARHLDLVYSAARRQVGSPQLAEEIAQSVFLDLARQARRGPLDGPLGAWLYVVTRRTAVDAIRRESRQRVREQSAAELSVMNSANDSPWPRIEPLLDEAMAALPAPDRTALVLRYFENKSLREVGAALGASEDAAQKRVGRALEELRSIFFRRGIPVASAVLAADLASSAAGAAPLGLGGTITAGAMTSAVPASALIFAMTTIQKTVVATVLVFALGAVGYEARQMSISRERVAALEKEASAARAREQILRGERNELVRRLASAPAANGTALRAPGGGTVMPDRATLLKQLLATMPERWIPELALLTDEDWLRAAEQDRWETEFEQREAFSTLRQRAKTKFVRQLQAAAKAQGGPFPSEMSQLLPYFDPPIDPTILQRYEILPLGPEADPKAVFPSANEVSPRWTTNLTPRFRFPPTGIGSMAATVGRRRPSRRACRVS